MNQLSPRFASVIKFFQTHVLVSGQYVQPLNARHFDCVLCGNQNGNLSFKLTLTEEET